MIDDYRICYSYSGINLIMIILLMNHHNEPIMMIINLIMNQ